MGGIVALVGSGEFTSAMDAVDGLLLEATGRDHPRVAVVPTASWPDGEAVFMRWADLGIAHFEALGAEAAAVLVGDLESADEPTHVAAIAAADLVYFSGGKPGHLLDSLRGTALGTALLGAHARGAVVAGCSAGAMVLGAHQLRVGGRGLQSPIGWQEALGIAPRLVIVPHYDVFPETLVMAAALAVPKGDVIVGIDEETALLGRDGEWRVHGRGRVTVWRRSRRERHRAGSAVRP
jgi:cyanophycinase